MVKRNAKTLLLVGAIALVSLTGCGQAEQATNEAIEKVRQSASQTLEEARQSGSLDQARELANQVLQDARQQAADLLGQASEFLAQDQQGQDIEAPVEPDSLTAI